MMIRGETPLHPFYGAHDGIYSLYTVVEIGDLSQNPLQERHLRQKLLEYMKNGYLMPR